jgi:uncharacterized membrane-anchored protein YitT (DUF2179 family)
MSLPARRLSARRAVALATMASFALATSGCATYAPIAQREAPGAGEVRLLLTDRGSVELAAQVGPQVVSLEGRVREMSDSTLRLALSSVQTRTGDPTVWVGEPVTVPVAYVASFQRRQPSRSRTVLLAGAITATVVAIGAGFTLISNGTSGGGGGTPVPR